MTQDCSLTPSIANETDSPQDPRFPKGIHVTETDHPSGSGLEDISDSQSTLPWGYIYIHNSQLPLFQQQMEAYNRSQPEAKRHACFVHYSYSYKQKANGKGVEKKQAPTISGLVFLQGHTPDLQQFLQQYYPQCHLINNCSTGRPASISHQVMRPFMQAISAHPERVTFLRAPFLKFAKDHVKLRVLTGLFRGLEGYIVRVDRDRQLVMEFGGYAVAIRGVHNEDFEVVE